MPLRITMQFSISLSQNLDDILRDILWNHFSVIDVDVISDVELLLPLTML